MKLPLPAGRALTIGLGRRPEERDQFPALSMDDWASLWGGAFSFGGLSYPFLPLQQTLAGKHEEVGTGFTSYVQAAYRSNGPVFACILLRLMVFSEARFQYRDDETGKLHRTPRHDLAILDTPWPGAATGDLLARAIQDNDLAGNFFCVRRGGTLRRLRPDWVTIVVGSTKPGSDATIDSLNSELMGYLYHPGGATGQTDPIALVPEEVCHFAPIPDPLFRFRGMSWLQPVIQEVIGDTGMTRHKNRFLEQGACQPLDAQIVTPTGWKAMGDVRVGDHVIGQDGGARAVLGVYPQGERDVYRVTMSNGTSTECDDRHVWRVETPYDTQRGLHQLKTLRELLDEGISYRCNPKALKWRVPLAQPVEYAPAASLPVDPYLLGALLGDGSFRGKLVTLTVATADLPEMELAIAGALPAGMRATRNDKSGCTELNLRGPGGPRTTPLKGAVRGLGLDDVIGHEKWIPDVYLRAATDDRVALLQGLLDTDGHVDPGKSAVTFSSTSHRLALGIQELARSLGGIASCNCDNGRGLPDRRPQWRVYIRRLPAWIIPFRLSRKARDYVPPEGIRQSRHTYIARVERVGRKAVQCIRVDDPDGLYLTDDFIVTHNTPNLVVTLDKDVVKESFDKFVEKFNLGHRGVANAYKTIFLAGATNVQALGANLQQMDFKDVQAIGESRIAAAAGVPPILVGFTAGLESGTLANYEQARRRFADGTMSPLWRNFSESMRRIVRVPDGSTLWYDTRDIPFLRSDKLAEAQIHQTEASTIASLVQAGFTPKTVVPAVLGGDLSSMKHSGLYSVQLQPPGELGEPGGPTSLDDVPPVPALPAPNGNGENGTRMSRQQFVRRLEQLGVPVRNGSHN